MAIYDLGQLESDGENIDNYSVTPWDPTDLFEFTVASPR